MTKLEFFLAAMQADQGRRRGWVISAFSLISEGPDDWKKNPYPYRIVQTPAGKWFVDPNNDNQLSPIVGTIAGEPPFNIKDRIALKAGSVPNLNQDIETTYGNLLFNYTAVIYPFGTKIPYQQGRVSPSDMEALILDRLKDTPKTDEPREDKWIYVDEYLKFADAMFYLAGFTQLCVPAGTRKTMTAPPGIEALKKRLLEENKDRLHDPATIAKIDAELVKADAEYLKGDASEGFLISNKSRNIVRKKLFLMHGAEVGLDEGVDVDLIQNSLAQGWDIDKFPAMNNSLRAGSYNRGAQTMLGGESVKWLLRASSNITVTKDDCGTRLGNVIAVTGDNYKWIEGFYVLTQSGDVKVDKETSKSYVGKTVTVRSPMFCKLDKTDYCAHCVGERLAENPTALSSAIADYGSVFLSIYMAAAHAKGLMLAKMDFKTAIQ